MVKWQTIEELKNIFINKYKNSDLGSELEKACSEEYELKRDYNGRQILELLQNVDDAYSQSNSHDKKEVSVKIVFRNNVLEVGNTGTSFSQETIERLCLGRVSDKTSTNIGNKGTGFRALLNDAEWIEVHSDNFSIRFSEKYAREQFAKCVDVSSADYSPLIDQQRKNWPKKDYELCFPIMNCPEQIAKHQSEFDTLIRVKVREENKNKDVSISNQLRLPFYKSLLFLPNITKIVIDIEGEVKQFEKICVGNKVLLAESQNTRNAYYVQSKEVAVTATKVANLIVAVPLSDNYDFASEKLYCYFPIRDFPTPVNALIHAPFLTNNSRDDVPNDNEQINKKIFEECLKFLKEIAENMTRDSSMAACLPIKTITPTNGFRGKLWDEDCFNLKSFYKQLLADAKLLPTVNGDFICVNDGPKCFTRPFPKQFRGELFKQLLTLLPQNAYDFVKQLADTSNCRLCYTEQELAEKINQITDSLDIPARVKVFLWWCENYRSGKELPHLLQDTTGNWIGNDVKIYLPTDTGVSILPASLSWVKLCILSQDYVDELVSQLKTDENWQTRWEEARSKLTAENTGNKRILDKISDTHFCVGFTEQSNADMIVEEINRQVDTKEKAISFINWFYANYKDKLPANSQRYSFEYKLPDIDGNLRTTSVLYFGKEYGNELAEKLFDNSKYYAVAPFEVLFNGLQYAKEEVVAFLKRCGVSAYPKAYLNNGLAYDVPFVNYVRDKYKFNKNINYLSVMYIDGFERALNTLSTEEVVQWITQDDDLHNLILSYEKRGYFNQSSRTNPIFIYSNEYILYILNKTKWIQIGQAKYSPKDIVKYPKLKNKIDGIYGIAEAELYKMLDKQTVQKLDFVDSLAAFPDDTIKRILVELPDFDKGEISRALYEDIIKLKKETDPNYTYSTAGIKVLATDGKYYDNFAVKYADRRLPKAVREANLFIHIPTKRSTETIKKWLGVERYKTTMELVDYLPLTQSFDFEREVSDIRISALAVLDENSHVSAVKNIKIVPCKYIRVKDIDKNNNEFDLDDYNYIKKDGKYYIKIPAGVDLKDIRGALDFRNSITEIFEDTLRRQIDAHQFACLLMNDGIGKRETIRDQYGVDKWNAIHELLYQSSIINDTVVQFFATNGANEQLLSKLKGIDFSDELSVEQFRIFKAALLAAGKDVKDVNSLDGQLAIDVRPCLKQEFNSYKETKAEVYRVNCYIYALENASAQSTFYDDCNSFRCYQLDTSSLENTINVNFDDILKGQFAKYNPAADCSNVDIDGKYDENFRYIISQGFNRDELELYIETHSAVKSMLYFDVPETLLQQLTAYCDQLKTADAPQQEQSPVDFIGETSTVETTLVPADQAQEHEPQVKSEKGQKQQETENAKKERAGKRAEQIAYAELKKDYPNLIWHSKNSDIPADKNKGPIDIVCDMWSTDANNVKTYFEVKSATTEFEMPISEYNSMLAAPNEYVVVLVDIATNEISKHKLGELDGLKQVSKYKFCFTQIKK